MKALRIGLSAVMVFILLGAMAACAIAAEAEREADHIALRALRDKVTKGINSQNVPALVSCFAKEFAFTTVDQTILTSESQMKNFFDRSFHSKDALVTGLTVEPQADILTRFLDDNTGICYGTSKDTYTLKDGQVVTMNVRWTATVLKENGEWKVATAHVGTSFLDNPAMKRLGDSWKKLATGIAVVGVVAGIFLGWLMFRRKQIGLSSAPAKA